MKGYLNCCFCGESSFYGIDQKHLCQTIKHQICLDPKSGISDSICHFSVNCCGDWALWLGPLGVPNFLSVIFENKKKVFFFN